MKHEKGNMKYDEALHLAKINAQCDDCMIWRCTSKLRNEIFALQSKQIFEPIIVDNIMKGEVIPPDSVKSFFKMFYIGNVSTTEELSSWKSQLINSRAADAVFYCSAGKFIPGKQLSLGFLP